MQSKLKLHDETRSSESLVLSNRTIKVTFAVHRRARRYSLRVRPDGTTRVTVARCGSLRNACEFVQRNLEWIEQQLELTAARPKAETSWRAGSQLLFRGEVVTIHFRPS